MPAPKIPELTPETGSALKAGRRPGILELIPESRCTDRRFQSWLLKTGGRTQDSRVESWKQLPDPRFLIWRLKPCTGPKVPGLTFETKTRAQDSRVDSWNHVRSRHPRFQSWLLKTGARTQHSKLIPANRCPHLRFQSWLLKTGARTQDSRVDSWNRVGLKAGRRPGILELIPESRRTDRRFQSWLLKTGGRTQDSRVESWKQLPDPRFLIWRLKPCTGPKVPGLTFETKTRAQDSRVDSWNHVRSRHPRFQSWLLKTGAGTQHSKLIPANRCPHLRFQSWLLKTGAAPKIPELTPETGSA